MPTLSEVLRGVTMEMREAQMLAAHALGIGRANVIANPDRVLTDDEAAVLRELLVRRARGEPFAYITGSREFYGRDFKVSPAVLIPRPETETLVELALARLSRHFWPESAVNRRLSVLDLGTGSGAIAVTLACERPEIEVVAADLSVDALALAHTNATVLGANVRFVQSDWGNALADETFDVIVSNPPYVAGGDAHLSQGDLRFEPVLALTDGSSDGLGSIRRILAFASTHLRPHGWLLIEHGYDQAAACRTLFEQNGLQTVESVCDLSGIERVTLGRI